MNVETVEHPEKAARVRAMFDQIAPRYDLLNHVLSLNIDKLWRRVTVREVSDALSRPGARALDLCCGTGDLSLALARGSRAPVVGLDFCAPMLDVAKAKVPAGTRVTLVRGDATGVPFPDASFDAITIAFGLRNLSSVEAGLAEIYRLLRPGGRAAILEFSRPVVPLLREAFGFYFTRILPRIGGIVSGSPGAYAYLPASVKAFPDQRALEALMERAGFASVRYRNLSAGIAALHVGERPAAEAARP
jgi:demethylmenaquinone methyltransferase/2-methoxy-6-polyprenyl-1,4-benzoquinol methylase